MGRVKLQDGIKKDKYLKVRTTQEQLAELDTACYELGLDRSSLIRIAVLDYLRERGLEIWARDEERGDII